jgi:RHS repeat-associated protein
VTNYVYDAVNRLASVNGQAYTWDDNGNLVNDGATQYAYDQANRLIRATLSTTTTQYAYNGDGARLKQVVNGLPTTYTLDLDAPLVQVLVMQNAGNTTAYEYGLMRIGEQQSTGWVYHLSDALGSVRQLADDGGQITLARGYTPYGELLWSQGTGRNAYGYTGEPLDVSTGLVFLRARYMRPRLGMFTSRAPWEGAILQSETMNGWGYGFGNPVEKHGQDFVNAVKRVLRQPMPLALDLVGETTR